MKPNKGNGNPNLTTKFFLSTQIQLEVISKTEQHTNHKKCGKATDKQQTQIKPSTRIKFKSQASYSLSLSSYAGSMYIKSFQQTHGGELLNLKNKIKT